MNTQVNALNLPPRRSALAGFIRWAVTLLIICGVVFAGYFAYSRLNLAPADVYVVHRGTAVSAVYGTVTINANAAITLLAQNSGFLHMDPTMAGTPTTLNGQKVKLGQLIATVVDEAGQRQFSQAKMDYEAALARQKTGPTTTTALQAAKATVAAYDKLPKGAVPQVTVDAARGEVTRLQGATDNEVADLQHAVDVTLNAMKTYEEQVKRTRVESPMDGVLSFIGFGDNSYVLTNQALFTISTEGMYVSGQVNEEDVGALKEGMKAEMRLYAYPTTTFNATLTAVLPSPVDPNSSRYTVLFNLDEPPDNLRYGLTGEMNVILGRKPNAIIVPARAVNVDQMFIVDDGVVEQRTVKVGFKSLEFAEILDGISEGDFVIVADQDAFRPGERVRPVPINQGAGKAHKK